MENFNSEIHEKINGGYQLKQTEQSAVRIRQITKGAFRRRLTTAEKVAIKSSTNPVVKVLEDDLLSTSFVDLDGQQLIDGLAYLIKTSNDTAPLTKKT